MATIEEMAEEYNNQQTEMREFCGNCDSIETAYKKGANAVLEEIEKALDTSFENLSILDAYKATREKIKELKGE